MGLDTVELIVSIEQYFKIVIADKEAERLNTLGDVTHLICEKLNITSERDRIFVTFYDFVREILITHQYLPTSANANDDIFQYLDISDKSIVKEVSSILQIEVPLNEPSVFPIWHRLFSEKQESISFYHFVESLAIYNYSELYEYQNFSSMRQVYFAVAMLTFEKSGVTIYELGRDKSFTNDLGMD